MLTWTPCPSCPPVFSLKGGPQAVQEQHQNPGPDVAQSKALSHWTEVQCTVYWLTVHAQLCVRQQLTSQPCQEPQLARLWRKRWLLSKEKFSISSQRGQGTNFTQLAGSVVFWCSVQYHIRILPGATRQKKCHVNPWIDSRVSVMPEEHFGCLHCGCSIKRLSSAGPLLWIKGSEFTRWLLS